MNRKIFLKTLLALVLFSCAVHAEDSDGYTVVQKEDFENFEVGVLAQLSEHNTVNLDNISFEGYSGDILEIAEENGNKFLKVTVQDKSTSNKILKYYFDTVYNGEVKVSYDFTPTVSSKWFDAFGALQTGTKEQNSSVVKIISYGANAYLDSVGSKFYIPRALSNSERKNIRISQTIEIGKENYSFDMVSENVSNNNIETVHHEKTVTAPKNVMGLSWIMKNGSPASYNGPDCNADSSNAGVYYIDNITVEQKVFCVKETYPKNESEDVSIGEEIKLIFNSNVAKNFKEYIEIYNGEIKLTEGYEIVENGKEVTLNFTNGLSFDNNYRVVIKKGLTSLDSKYVPIAEDYILSFKTESILPEVLGVEDGKSYNKKANISFLPCEGTELIAEISYNGGEFKEYISGTELTDEGEYILKLKAKKDGKEEIRNINFRIVGLVAPRVENVKVSNDGLIYKGEYQYVDDNGDEENKEETELIWEVKDDELSSWTEIGRGEEITVTEDMVDKILRFCVIPVSVNEPVTGEAAYSKEIFLPARPVVDGDVEITGEGKLNSKLTVKYTYKDKNNDEESGTVFAWFKADEEGNIKSRIDNADSKEYVISESDMNGYIVCKVIPKNEGFFGEGAEYVSKPFLLPYMPEIKNLKIDNAYSGKSAQAIYEFFDKNGDKEAASKIEWYLNDDLVSTAPGYYIDKNVSGTLTLRVTPVSDEYPYEGEVQEVSVNIKKKTSNGGSSSSSYGGGYAISAGSGVAKIEPETNVENNKLETEDIKKLNDIKGHWAEESIERMFEKGVITGDENQNFNPEKSVTRAEASAIVVRALGLEEEYRKLFDDVEADKWYAEYVCAAANEKIMNGDGFSFRPNDKITREELCVVIANILNYKKSDVKKGKIDYKDSEMISIWAKEAVEICVGLDLIKGMEDNSLAPKQTATRAQMAVIMERVLGYEEK